MKLNQIQSKTKRNPPFVKTDELEIAVQTEGEQISGFTATVNGYSREFKAKGDPEKAFKEMERFLDKLI